MIGWGAGKKAFQFAPDGYVHCPPGNKLPKTWAAVSPGTVISFPPNTADAPVDVFTIDLDKGTVTARCIGNLKTPRSGWDAVLLK